MELEGTIHYNKNDRSIIPTIELENSHDMSMPLIIRDEADNTGETLGTQ